MTAAGAPQNATLADRLGAEISRNGPIGVDRYMAACLGDAQQGYYTGHDPFGMVGDFVTAPEISGLFGEMCGAYLGHMFELCGAPAAGHVVELGPGRGSLMRDMQHLWTRLVPGLASLPVHLVETSPALKGKQAATLQPLRPHWHDAPTSLPDGPVFGVANEFFDALPMAQFVWRQTASSPGAWYHRLVGLRGGAFCFVDGAPLTMDEEQQHQAALPATPEDGFIAEVCPAAAMAVTALAERVSRHGGAVLIIDYGRNGNGGDSLQAVAEHRPVDIFHDAGKADLSHWVDFAALRRAAEVHGCRFIGPVPQGRFLMRIGLAARAEQAGLHAAPDQRRALLAAIDRLTSPVQMGEVFKVALLVPPGHGTPPGFDDSPATDGAA